MKIKCRNVQIWISIESYLHHLPLSGLAVRPIHAMHLNKHIYILHYDIADDQLSLNWILRIIPHKRKMEKRNVLVQLMYKLHHAINSLVVVVILCIWFSTKTWFEMNISFRLKWKKCSPSDYSLKVIKMREKLESEQKNRERWQYYWIFENKLSWFFTLRMVEFINKSRLPSLLWKELRQYRQRNSI